MGILIPDHTWLENNMSSIKKVFDIFGSFSQKSKKDYFVFHERYKKKNNPNANCIQAQKQKSSHTT